MNFIVACFILLPTLVYGCVTLLKKDPRDFYVGMANWSDTTVIVYCSGAILATNETYTVLILKECYEALNLPLDQMKLIRWNPSNHQLITGKVADVAIIGKYVAIKPRPNFIQRYENIFLNKAFDRENCNLIYPEWIGATAEFGSVNVQPLSGKECLRYVKTNYFEEVSQNVVMCFVARYNTKICKLGTGSLLACNKNKELGAVGFAMEKDFCYEVFVVRNTKYLDTTKIPVVTVMSALTTKINLSNMVLIFIICTNLIMYL